MSQRHRHAATAQSGGLQDTDAMLLPRPKKSFGFYNAPATLLIWHSVVTFSVAMRLLKFESMFPRKYVWGFALKDSLPKLALSFAGFETFNQTVCAALIIYHMRQLERIFSTRKFVPCILITSVLSAGLTAIFCHSLSGIPGFNTLAPGPYSLIFTSMFLYHRRVPEVEKVELFKLRFSQKYIFYLSSGLLFLSSWPRALVSAICGFFSAAIYSSNLFGMQKWRFPSIIEHMVSKLFSIDMPPPAEGADIVKKNDKEGVSQKYSEHAGDSAASGIRPHESSISRRPTFTKQEEEEAGFENEPTDEQVALLVSMGFDPEQSQDALRSCDCNLERTLEILLN